MAAKGSGGQGRIRLLHTYKVYMPDVFGGIPYVIERMLAVRPDWLDQNVLVCSTLNSDLDSDGKVERVRALLNLWSLPVAPTYPYRLWRRLADLNVVIHHAPFPLADVILGLLGARKAKLIVFWHSDIVRQRILGWLLRPLIQRTLQHASLILVSNEALINPDSLVAGFKYKVRELPFPVNLERFMLSKNQKEKADQIRMLFPNLVLSIGRLVSYKGYEVLIDAAQTIDASFCIIGEGPERKNLEAKIKQLNLQGRVVLLGTLSEEDMVVYLEAAKLFVLPSVSSAETFGIAQLEALAAGKAVINTNLPTAVPRIARDGVEAITVAPDNVKEMADAIATLLADDDRRITMAKAARERAAQFSDAAFSNTFSAIINEVLAESKSTEMKL